MQIIVYFSTLEIHDGSTACEISISWNTDGSRVLTGTQRHRIHFNCDITCSSILRQVYALSLVIRVVSKSGFLARVSGTGVWFSLRVD